MVPVCPPSPPQRHDGAHVAAAAPSTQGDRVDTADSLRDLSLLEFVRSQPASVRLLNCIQAADGARRLPFNTVGDYVRAGPQAVPQLLGSVRSFGRKTAAELDALVQAAKDTGAARRAVSHATPLIDRDALKTSLINVFATVDTNASMAEQVVPTRLSNALARSGYATRPLSAVLLDLKNVNRRIAKTSGIGKSSMTAWNEVLAKIVDDRLIRLGVSPEGLGDVRAFLLSEGVLSDGAAEALLTRLEGAAAASEARSEASEAHDVESVLRELISTFDRRSQDVIVRRFGLHDSSPATLEEIGGAYGVTRERIRQIEAKAIKKLRVRAKIQLAAAIATQMPQTWEALVGGVLVLAEADLPNATKRLSPWLMLALDVCQMPVVAWLNTHAHAIPGGWLASTACRARFRARAAELGESLSGRALPVALCELAAPEEITDTAAVIRLRGDVRLYRGYVTRGTIGARLRRAIGLHEILVAAGVALELTDLTQRYVNASPSAMCSTREAAITMEQQPHLFIEVLDGLWCALGRSGAHDRDDTARYEDRSAPASEDDAANGEVPPDELAKETQTVAGALERELRRRGPMRLSELIERGSEILPPDRSTRSIGPTLIVCKDLFTRPLPGVYALAGQTPTGAKMIDAPPPYMLDAEQARLYALARRSGEEWRTFPLWAPETEYVWCRWARRYADSELLESLLSIASVECWPIDEGEKSEWRAFALARGRFSITFPPNAAAFTLPALDRILAASLVIRAQGHMGWMGGNRILLRRVGDHGSAGLLAVLIALGALAHTAPDWQLPHAAGPALDSVVERLAAEHHRTGELRWHSLLGASLMTEALSRPAFELGWLSRPLLARLFSPMMEPNGPTPEALDPLDRLLGERKASTRTASFKAALGSLQAAELPAAGRTL